jgi:uncharacterized protein (TIGR03435 family)
VLAVVLVSAAYGLFGQSDSRPAFQSVTIKRDTSDWNDRFRHPMGLRNNASLLLLIQFAYAPHDNPMAGHSVPLPAFQVAGGPAWIDSEGYDIDAKAKDNTDPSQWWAMWQTLLADRFQLKLHRETRELPVYILKATNSGLKLPPAQEAECVSFSPGSTPKHVPGKVDCGYVSGPFGDGGRLRIEGSKVHVPDLIKELALILNRPVLNETGFTGEFDLNLTFAADQNLRGMPSFVLEDPAGSRAPKNPGVPNLFAALEQQLGLELRLARGPVEVLVVDHAERPVEN